MNPKRPGFDATKDATKTLPGICALASLALLLIGSGCRSTPFPAATAEPQLLKLSGDLSVHDPVIIKEENTYYIFCTGGGRRGGIIPIRCSTNLLNWTRCGSVFETLPAWATNEIPLARGVWAPDISYLNGKYYLSLLSRLETK